MDFLYILDLCACLGFLGIHRIYLKKIFSGVLYILNFAVILAIILLSVFFKVNVNVIVVFFFVLFTVQYGMWIRDLILIVTGKFKDKNNKIISNVTMNDASFEYVCVKKFFRRDYEKYLKYFKNKKDVLKNKNLNFSDKDIFILYYLTGELCIKRNNIFGFFGLYKFYSEKYLSGFLNIILMLVDVLLFLIMVFCERESVLFKILLIFVVVLPFFIYSTVLYDKYRILSGKYKDCCGKYICLNFSKDQKGS